MKKHRNKRGQYTIDPTFRAWMKWSMILMFFITLSILVGVNFKRVTEGLLGIGREFNPIHNVSAESEIKYIQDNKSWIDAKIEKVAAKYGRSAYQMKRTVQCESGYQNIQSKVITKTGARENSWGIYQIYLTDHKDVSREEALDVDFAIEWAAQHWNDVAWYGYNRKTDTCN